MLDSPQHCLRCEFLCIRVLTVGTRGLGGICCLHGGGGWGAGRHTEKPLLFLLQAFCASCAPPLKKKYSAYGSLLQRAETENHNERILSWQKYLQTSEFGFLVLSNIRMFTRLTEAPHEAFLSSCATCFLSPVAGFLKSHLVNEVVFSWTINCDRWK